MERKKYIGVNVLLKILLFLPGIILIFTAFHAGYWYQNPDECHSVAFLNIWSYQDIFNKFMQGANFLPLYKLILKIIYDLNDNFVFVYFKIPSLIAGICSLFMFYKLSHKFFDNKFLAIITCLFFSFNYEIIFYSTQIKPYIFDVLFCSVILYGFIKFHSIDIKQTFNSKYKFCAFFIILLFSLYFMLYFSLTSIIVFHSCMLYAVISAIKKRDKQKLFYYLLFEAGVLLFNLFEYVTYIRFMMEDTGLDNMWKCERFYFKPDNLDAFNSIFNFIFYHFDWFDSDTELRFSDKLLNSMIIIYILGSISALKSKTKFYAVMPVITTLIISFAGIYPFCNRPIVFLIPSFILIPFCILDIPDKQKLKLIAKFTATAILYGYIITAAKYGYLHNLIHTNTYIKSEWDKNILPLYNVKNNEAVITTGNVCLFCNNNPDIRTDNLYEMNDEELDSFIKDLSEDKNIIYYNYNKTCVEQDFAENIRKVIENNNYDCSYTYDNSEEYFYYKCRKK